MTDNDSANCGRAYQSNILPLKKGGNSPAKGRRFIGVLQNQSTLKINTAVQPAREQKVTFQQRPGCLELFYDLLGVQKSLLEPNICMLQS
jgi:hypothetical protein